MLVGNKLSGVGTALATPFTEKGEVDYPALGRIVEYSIASGVDFLVALGTTGESPTLRKEEKAEVCRAVARFAAGRVPLVMGLGGNDTLAVVEQLKSVDTEGYSYLLSVAPYYNKPGQRGFYAHYRMIAENASLPVIIYNIPSRCGANIEPEVIVRLAREIPNIAAVKEASGNLGKIGQILRDRPEGFSVLSGDDSLTLPLMAMGADGVISTGANLIPKEMCQLVRFAYEGKMPQARKVHYRIMELLKLFFEQGNPSGIKAGLAIRGFCENTLRLPLVPATDNLYQRMEEALDRLASEE